MSGDGLEWRESPEAPEAEERTEPAELLRQRLRQFAESRLYTQALLTAALLAAGAVVALFPVGPLSRAHRALTWVVTEDYDFAGRAREADRWAKARGGWVQAAAGVWRAGAEKIERWVAAAPASPAPEEAAAQAPAQVPAQAPVVQPALVETTPARDSVLPVTGRLLVRFETMGGAMHEGLDFAAPLASTVVAVREGTVLAVTADARHGKAVEVDHGQFVARYAQVDGIRVRQGQRVSRGEPLAAVALPAGLEKEMAPHLHLEIRARRDGKPIDPAPYLPLGSPGGG